MTTASHQTHDASADHPQDTKKRKPDYTDEAWAGRGRYLRIACWDDEIQLEGGGTFLAHKVRLTAGYVEDGEFHDGEPVWLQSGQALRLSAMLAALDRHETAADKEFRQARKEGSN
jgi:hypothetical protein